MYQQIVSAQLIPVFNIVKNFNYFSFLDGEMKDVMKERKVKEIQAQTEDSLHFEMLFAKVCPDL